MYAFKGNPYRHITHFKCIWKALIAVIPLENSGSSGLWETQASLSEFYEFLFNYNNNKKNFVKTILEGFVLAIGKLSVHSVGGWLFYFVLFLACDSCLKVICYHHGSQLLDESKCLSGLL